MWNHYKYQQLLLQIPRGSQVGVSPHNLKTSEVPGDEFRAHPSTGMSPASLLDKLTELCPCGTIGELGIELSWQE